jgi:trans-feruloyl-CoA hydratase/vanillin synthase
VLRAAKHAYKHVRDMTWENAADYLSSKMDQTSYLDPSNGRAEGMKQFLDEKSFKPGLGAYKKS